MGALGTMKKPRPIRALAHQDLIGHGELRLAYKVNEFGIFSVNLGSFPVIHKVGNVVIFVLLHNEG